MSPMGQKRGPFNPEPRQGTGDERSSEYNVDEASDSNVKWTSTPLKKRIEPDRLRRRLSTPAGFDSEESTEVRSPARSLPRRRSAKSIRRDRASAVKRIDTADRRGKIPGRSKRRKSEGYGPDGLGEVDDSILAGRRGAGRHPSEKRGRDPDARRQEGGGSQSAELPIAELLRKAQENQKNPQQFQSKYEQPMPIPLPELTTNTVYVQGRDGFSAVKIRPSKAARSGNKRFLKPIHVAIRIHNLSRSLMLLCHGLLGGIALSQVVLVTNACADHGVSERRDGGTDYYSRIMSAIFLFLNTVCLLSSMDRIDLAHLDLEHLREITCHRCMLLATLPLYLATICIHIAVINGDERLACGARELVESKLEIADGNSAQREIRVWKFALCIAAWICVALGPTDDMTATHLDAMQKYTA